METRFRLCQRASGVFYLEDTLTLRQASLKTKDKTAAQRLFQAQNGAHEQPALNLQLARTYLAASDPEVVKRTWQTAMDAITHSKNGVTRERWLRAVKDHAFDSLRGLVILETTGEQLFAVLEQGTVATNVFLRRLHNFALDMNWLPWPVIPKRQWPAVHYKDKRAITLQEHLAILARVTNVEQKLFYELCWHLGGSQSDIANLRAKTLTTETESSPFTDKRPAHSR